MQRYYVFFFYELFLNIIGKQNQIILPKVDLEQQIKKITIFF